MIGGSYLLKIFGKPTFQKYWEYLLNVSLIGMNIGCGSEIENSGESYVIDYVVKNLHDKKSLTIFDVGANKGNYALFIHQKLKENDYIYCFEPSRPTFDTLINNVKNKKNIFTFNFGFGEKNEYLTLFSNKPGSGIASVYKRRLDHFDEQMNLTEEIYLTTLDNFSSNNRITQIDLLKLDVEGHEMKVLSGARKLINSQSINFIQFEFGGCNIDSKTYFQDFFYLLNDKYKIYRILKSGISEINHYKEIYEQFGTTNFLAISRKYS